MELATHPRLNSFSVLDKVKRSDFSILGVKFPSCTRRIPNPSNGSWPITSVVVEVAVDGVIGGTELGVAGVKGHRKRGLDISPGCTNAGDDTLLLTESFDLPRPAAEDAISCNDPDLTSCFSVEANPNLLPDADEEDEAAESGVWQNSGLVGVGRVEGRNWCGSWYSRLTTTRVTCSALRARREEACSRAVVSRGGSWCASRTEIPASRGDEMRSLRDMVTGVFVDRQGGGLVFCCIEGWKGSDGDVDRDAAYFENEAKVDVCM